MKNEIDEELKRFNEWAKQTPRDKLAYAIIKQFSITKDVSPELTERFHMWLADPRDADAKDRALKRIFDETMCGSPEHGLADVVNA